MDEIRRNILAHYSEHIASSFSCVEILDALYGVSCEGILQPEDVFILSKGHAAPALYTILAMKGVLKWSDLPRYGLHCVHTAPGVSFITGSLGCGLGLGAGVALARRLKGASGRVYVLCGDGELYEGSIWEGVRFAGRNELSNLTMVLDYNGKAALGAAPQGIIHKIFQHFDWWAYCVPHGHDVSELSFIMRDEVRSRPTLHFCLTTKGKGIPELENDPLCHVRKVVGGKIVK